MYIYIYIYIYTYIYIYIYIQRVELGGGRLCTGPKQRLSPKAPFSYTGRPWPYTAGVLPQTPKNTRTLGSVGLKVLCSY